MPLMIEDIVFLTSGSAPIRRKDFAANFASLIATASVFSRSRVQEITIEGDETRKHVGNTLTVFRRGTNVQWRIWRDANLLALV
jgi:hypothetical protein